MKLKQLSLLSAAIALSALTTSPAPAAAQQRLPVAREQSIVLAQANTTPQQSRRRSNTGRNVAVGVGAGLAAAILLNEAAKAAARRDEAISRINRAGPACRELARRCDNGNDSACRRFDRRGC